MSDKGVPCSSHSRSLLSWSVSAVNALVGDHLRDQQNGLAVEMAFYARNRPLVLSREALADTPQPPTSRVVVLVHGLGCHEGIWAYQDPEYGPHPTSYGARLRSDLGYTPFFVRYNTGLRIDDNGAHLAALLDRLLALYPVTVDELVLIGHSMGGLVIGAAATAAERRRSKWLRVVRRVIYLGTPHEGAPLARLGDKATAVLQMVPNPITRLISGIMDQRSSGLKELRGAGRAAAGTVRVPVGVMPPPWSPRTRHYLVVGTLTDDPGHLATALFGDGLVLLPTHDDPHAAEHVRLFPCTHHLQLTRDHAVYEQIRTWCDTH